MSTRILERKLPVCDKCLQVSCLAGVFMCEESRGAGVTDLSILKLSQLGYENPEWWFKDPSTGAIDQHALAEFKALEATPTNGRAGE